MNGIHALGAGASMAAVGASAIDGGNWRIFAAMLAESDAALRLETEVRVSFRVLCTIIDV
jgi:prenylcysteine oxidase / farnesylcysteine lyase